MGFNRSYYRREWKAYLKKYRHLNKKSMPYHVFVKKMKEENKHGA